MGFSRQEYWSGLPCPPPRDLPRSGVELESVTSPALAGGFFTTSATWEALVMSPVLETQLCLTLFDSMDCSPPGSSVHRILQVRILERVAIPFSRRSSPTQGSNSDLLLCRQILYHLSHQRSPVISLDIAKWPLEVKLPLVENLSEECSIVEFPGILNEYFSYVALKFQHTCNRCFWNNDFLHNDRKLWYFQISEYWGEHFLFVLNF